MILYCMCIYVICELVVIVVYFDVFCDVCVCYFLCGDVCVCCCDCVCGLMIVCDVC